MSATHACNNLIVSCMDFRIQTSLRDWAEQHLKGEKYDYVSIAGSTKELTLVLFHVDIACRLHGIKHVFLIHHEDCGACGERESIELHTAELNRARQSIQERYPDLSVERFYLKLNGEVLPISRTSLGWHKNAVSSK